MSFSSAFTSEIQKVGAGERLGSNNIILNADAFEDGLVIGRFAKWDSARLDNMDGSATPVIAGVPLRMPGVPIDDGDTIGTDITKQLQFLRTGLVTVEAVTGQNPTKFAEVFASNAGDADDGKASITDDASTETTGAEFIREVDTDVWLVLIK